VPHSNRGLAATLLLVASSGVARAQAVQQPVNDPPNPYQTVEGWAKLPEGRTWGSTSAVAIDKEQQADHHECHDQQGQPAGSEHARR